MSVVIERLCRLMEVRPLYCYKCGNYLSTDYEQKHGTCLRCLSEAIRRQEAAD